MRHMNVRHVSLVLLSCSSIIPFVNREVLCLFRKKNYNIFHKKLCLEPNSLDGKGMCLLVTIINKLEYFHHHHFQFSFFSFFFVSLFVSEKYIQRSIKYN